MYTINLSSTFVNPHDQHFKDYCNPDLDFKVF